MFSNLTAFAMVRTGKQALGFYIVYLVIAIIVGGIAGGLGGLITSAAQEPVDMQVGVKWGAAAAVVYVILIGMIIVIRKKLGIGYVILALVGGLLALVGGGVLGLIPAALMTTRPEPITIATDFD